MLSIPKAAFRLADERINHVRRKNTHLLYCLKFPPRNSFNSENENILKAIAMINHPNIDLSIQDDKGKTALDIAREKGIDDIVELIESKLNA